MYRVMLQSVPEFRTKQGDKVSSDVEAERRELMMVALRSPKTLNELIDELGTSRMTVYRTLEPLIKEHLVKEVPFKKGRQKKWMLVNTIGGGNVINIYSPAGVRPLGEYIGATHNPIWEGRLHDVDGALAQIWRYCAYHSNPDGTEKAKAGSMTPVECKTALRNAKEFFERLNSVLEQVLLADIYDDASLTTAEKFGEVNLLTAIEIGSAFEKRHGHG